ncbi:MAG: 5-methyltetrahydropteroyltriglutamate--homocysteine S-methyltransferase [Betaproteobacteria bacterium]|nr:5-methyltetrahydropteroyltriglutamate--homocysteine S-methyltransferase [Betaproteobacteria bacterium]
MNTTKEKPHLPCRAEHIGSLLRPPELVEAMARKLEGSIDEAELRAIQDRAIDDVLRLQEDLGYRAVNDGEYRRVSYLITFMEQGFSVPYAKSTTALQIKAPVRWQGPVHVDEYRYVASRARTIGKVTLLGPCRVHWQTGRNNIDRHIYPDIAKFWDDIVAATRSEIRALAEAGCRYIQIDDTAFAKFSDPQTQAQLASRGEDWRELIPLYIEMTNRVVADPPPGMTIALHMCRGNSVHHGPGHQRAAGGYDAIAERMFNELDIDIFFLEYDTPRAGDFSPLKYLPKGKSVVLGLVSTKDPELESAEHLRRRIDEAATYCELDQLAISPQCGFSSQFRGHPLSMDQQTAKLRRIAEVAQATWGGL